MNIELGGLDHADSLNYSNINAGLRNIKDNSLLYDS